MMHPVWSASDAYYCLPPIRSYEAGFRLLGLQHFADNDAGGSLHGAERGGLTPWGAQLLRRCEALGVAVDLAHASEAVVADALRLATKPLLVSHTGAAGHCPSGRTRWRGSCPTWTSCASTRALRSISTCTDS